MGKGQPYYPTEIGSWRIVKRFVLFDSLPISSKSEEMQDRWFEWAYVEQRYIIGHIIHSTLWVDWCWATEEEYLEYLDSQDEKGESNEHRI